MTRLGATFFAITSAALTLVACSIDPKHGETCYPGDFQWCLCADGTRGLQQCDTDAGAGYGACVCNAPDAGGASDAGAGANDAATCNMSGDSNLCLYSPCTSNAQCQSNDCYAFNAKGPHCSKPCKLDSDCPPPSSGCNMMGVCKQP